MNDTGIDKAAKSYQKGINLLNKKNYQKAVESFDQSLSWLNDIDNKWIFNIRISNIYFNKAIALMELEKYTEALDSINNTLKYQPYDQKALAIKKQLSDPEFSQTLKVPELRNHEFKPVNLKQGSSKKEIDNLFLISYILLGIFIGIGMLGLMTITSSDSPSISSFYLAATMFLIGTLLNLIIKLIAWSKNKQFIKSHRKYANDFIRSICCFSFIVIILLGFIITTIMS